MRRFGISAGNHAKSLYSRKMLHASRTRSRHALSYILQASRHVRGLLMDEPLQPETLRGPCDFGMHEPSGSEHFTNSAGWSQILSHSLPMDAGFSA